MVSHFICIIVSWQDNKNSGFLKCFQEFKLFFVCLCSGPLPSLFACNLSSFTFIEVFYKIIIGTQQPVLKVSWRQLVKGLRRERSNSLCILDNSSFHWKREKFFIGLLNCLRLNCLLNEGSCVLNKVAGRAWKMLSRVCPFRVIACVRAQLKEPGFSHVLRQKMLTPFDIYYKWCVSLMRQ